MNSPASHTTFAAVEPTAARGVIADTGIRRLMDDGALMVEDVVEGQIQPASLDLRLGRRAHRVRSSFLPGDLSVEDRLKALCIHSLDLADGAVLETGAVYIVELQEQLDLPETLAAFANPKSSTGRLDVFVRLITDHARAFDRIAAGYTGKLWLEIAPKTFPVLVRKGSRLTQIRFRQGEVKVSDEELAAIHLVTPLTSDPKASFNNGLTLGVDLSEALGDVIGWRARRHAGVVDVDRVDALAPLDYWEPIHRRPSGLVLDPGEFYILASCESVTIPPDLASEMVPFDAGLGELRSHYAGFLDPGFGFGTGSRAVLEVRPHDVPFLIEHGQPIARLIYERMIEQPFHLYGDGLSSNYQGQGLRLSKHFKFA